MTENNVTLNEQTLNKQTLNEQTLNEPTLNKQTLNEPTLNEQTLNEQTLNEPTLNEQTLNEPTLNEQTLNEPTLNEPDQSEMDQHQQEYQQEFIKKLNKMFDIVEANILEFIWSLVHNYEQFKDEQLIYPDIFNAQPIDQIEREPLILRSVRDLCDSDNYIRIRLVLEDSVDWESFKSTLHNKIPSEFLVNTNITKANPLIIDHPHIQQSVDFLKTSINYVWQAVIETIIIHKKLKEFLKNITLELDMNTLSFVPIYISEVRRNIMYLEETLENVEHKKTETNHLSEEQWAQISQFENNARDQLQIYKLTCPDKDFDSINMKDIDITNNLLKLSRLIVEYEVITLSDVPDYMVRFLTYATEQPVKELVSQLENNEFYE